MAEPARPFWEADELVAKAPPRKPAKGSRPFWEEDELVATKAETKANPGIWEAIGRGALQGTTLGGGDELYAAGAGALAKARGQDFGPEYDRQLAETQAANKAAKDAYPWAYGLAEAAGVLPGLIGFGTTALGARALGLAGGSFLARSAAAGASGAGIGAIQGAAGTDGGVDERLQGAKIGGTGGALVGAASPAVGAAVGKGVGMVSEAVRSRMAPNPAGLSNAAADLLAQDLKAAGGAGAVRSRLDELGPEARLLDASPSFQGRAQGLAIQPETREILVDPLVARNQGTNARLAADVDGAVGPAPIPSRVETGIRDAQRGLAPDYEAALDAARAVTRPAPSGVPYWGHPTPGAAGASASTGADTRSIAHALDAQIVDARGPVRTALENARSMLNLHGTAELDPSPRALFETRKALDGMIGVADRSGDRAVVRALTETRNRVDDVLGEVAPGIKAVDSGYAELARQSEGLQRGSQVFDGGKNAIRPADLADELATAALPQGEMVGPSAVPLRIRQGARAEIDRLVGTEANDLNALRKAIKGEGDWNYTKLVQTFGSRPAARIWNAVDREAAFREAYQNVVQGSQSAMRTGAAEGTKVRGSGGTAAAGLPAIAGAIGGPGAAATAAASQGLRAGANQVLKAADLARNRQIAESLIMQPGAGLDAVIDGLAQRIMAQSQSQMTAGQARELAQIMVMSQGENAGEGVRRLGGLGGLGGFEAR